MPAKLFLFIERKKHLNNAAKRSAPSVRKRQRHDRHRHDNSIGITESQSKSKHRHHFDPLGSDELNETRRLQFLFLLQLTAGKGITAIRRNPSSQSALNRVIPKSKPQRSGRRNDPEAILLGWLDQTKRKQSFGRIVGWKFRVLRSWKGGEANGLTKHERWVHGVTEESERDEPASTDSRTL